MAELTDLQHAPASLGIIMLASGALATSTPNAASEAVRAATPVPLLASVVSSVTPLANSAGTVTTWIASDVSSLVQTWVDAHGTVLSGSRYPV